jgi:1-deoxy-D-xylulose-5-phosphate reductoisomerase
MQVVDPHVRAAPNAVRAVRTVTVLGATGSVGMSTVDLLKRGNGHYRVEAVTAHKNGAQLAQIARDLNARFAVVADPNAYGDLKAALSGTGIEAASGEAAVVEAAERPADWVMAAVSGSVGLKPTLAAAKRGATVALANKECLVCAGAMFMRNAAASGASVLPVDSEHNAIFQALAAGPREDVSRIIITASGGPFRTWTREQMRGATLEQALKHPNWSMGPKITIDSATMMNKCLELIEAHHLFAIPPAQLAVLVHPQSIVHGMVQLCDGASLAHLGHPDMRVPIAYALHHPERVDVPVPRLDLAQVGALTFEEPDLDAFPCLRLSREAAIAGGTGPCVLNAANEVAVHAFLGGRLPFMGIPAVIEQTLERVPPAGVHSFDSLYRADGDARAVAGELVGALTL